MHTSLTLREILRLARNLKTATPKANLICVLHKENKKKKVVGRESREAKNKHGKPNSRKISLRMAIRRIKP